VIFFSQVPTPSTTSGNCAVFSLPLRDHNRADGLGAPGSTSTIARMPSTFGSYT
jgi:hypothetical protein